MNKLFLIFFQILTFGIQAQKLPDFIPFRQGELWGYSDSNKYILITPQYYNASLFHGNCAIVDDSASTYLINKQNIKICRINGEFNYFIDDEKKQIVFYKQMNPPCGNFVLNNNIPSIIVYDFDGVLQKTYFNTDIDLLFISKPNYVPINNQFKNLNEIFFLKNICNYSAYKNDYQTYSILIRKSDSAKFEFQKRYINFDAITQGRLIGWTKGGSIDIIDTSGRILMKNLSKRLTKDYFSITNYFNKDGVKINIFSDSSTELCYSNSITIINLNGDTIKGLQYDNIEPTGKDNFLYAENYVNGDSHLPIHIDIIELYKDTFRVCKSFDANFFNGFDGSGLEAKTCFFINGSKFYMINKNLEIFKISTFKSDFVKYISSRNFSDHDIRFFNDGILFNDLERNKWGKKPREKIKIIKQGIINLKGELIIPPKYEFVFEYSNDFTYLFQKGLIVVKDGGKQGLVNSIGKIIIKPEKYKCIFPSEENLFSASFDGFNWFFVDINGIEYYSK
ncbi:MAG: WG repeat-containing protein [Bacteroidetes bacterium]|nr:WG repeat-containing protein [Bacteroidota bacterium]